MNDFVSTNPDGTVAVFSAGAPELAESSLKEKSLVQRYGMAILLVAAVTLLMGRAPGFASSFPPPTEP